MRVDPYRSPEQIAATLKANTQESQEKLLDSIPDDPPFVAPVPYGRPGSAISIEFESRDALLDALCEKAFGAKPVFKNDDQP